MKKKSISAVLIGILLALLLGALGIFGIAAPFFTFVFGLEAVPSVLPPIIVVFAAAFAFYWGGMAAGYIAPSRHRLHGVMVGIVSFAISPLINLGGGADPFAGLRTSGTLLLTVLLIAVVLAASYVGAGRGAALYVQNEAVVRRQRSRRAQERPPDED